MSLTPANGFVVRACNSLRSVAVVIPGRDDGFWCAGFVAEMGRPERSPVASETENERRRVESWATLTSRLDAGKSPLFFLELRRRDSPGRQSRSSH